MFNYSHETLLEFSNGIASFLKNSLHEYFASSVENRANLNNLGPNNLAGCKCFFFMKCPRSITQHTQNT